MAMPNHIDKRWIREQLLGTTADQSRIRGEFKPPKVHYTGLELRGVFYLGTNAKHILSWGFFSEARLDRRKNNSEDPNSIAVEVKVCSAPGLRPGLHYMIGSFYQVGWVPREIAVKLAPMMDSGVKLAVRVDHKNTKIDIYEAAGKVEAPEGTTIKTEEGSYITVKIPPQSYREIRCDDVERALSVNYSLRDTVSGPEIILVDEAHLMKNDQEDIRRQNKMICPVNHCGEIHLTPQKKSPDAAGPCRESGAGAHCPQPNSQKETLQMKFAQLMDRFFRKVDSIVIDVSTGKTGLRGANGSIITVEKIQVKKPRRSSKTAEADATKPADTPADEAVTYGFQLIDTPFEAFALSLPGFATHAKLGDVSIGDIVVTNDNKSGWVVEKRGESSVRVLFPSGKVQTISPPKVAMLGQEAGLMVVRTMFGAEGQDQSLQSMLPMLMMLRDDGSTGDDTLGMMLAATMATGQGGQMNMMLPMLMMKGGGESDMKDLAICMMMGQSQGQTGNSLMPFVMMQIMKGKSGNSKSVF